MNRVKSRANSTKKSSTSRRSKKAVVGASRHASSLASSVSVSAMPQTKGKRASTTSTSVRKLASSAGKNEVPMSNLESRKYTSYGLYTKNLDVVRQYIDRPLTYAEKVVYSHLDNPHDAKNIVRGETYLQLRPGMFCGDDDMIYKIQELMRYND